MKKIDIKSVLIGLLIGTNLMFLIGAKQQPDDIVAKSIRINNDDGKPSVVISAFKDGSGVIATYNSDGKAVTYIGSNELNHGNFYTYNSDGKMTTSLGTEGGGNGALATYNSNGNRLVSVAATTKGHGNLKTYKSDGTITSFLGTTPDGAGALALENNDKLVALLGVNENQDGLFILYDRYGDKGWAVNGEK